MLDDEDFNTSLRSKDARIANSCNKGSRGAGLLAGYVGIRADVFILCCTPRSMPVSTLKWRQCPRIAPKIRFLTEYELRFILKSMKIGERGQVTIPKDIREQFGLGPETEVEFRVVGGSIVLKKAPKKLNLSKWKGRCGDAFAKLGYSTVDRFIDDVRDR